MGFRNGLTRLFAGLALLLGSMLTTPALAAGLMTPTNSGLPPLQIREQHVTVDVEDGYAITEVEQVFHNPNDQDLEAYYRFPVPERGTVAEFTVWIDGKRQSLVTRQDRLRDRYATPQEGALPKAYDR